MKKKRKWLVAVLSAIVLLAGGWYARAEIRGFFLSCGVFYRDVPNGLSVEELLAYQDFLEATICGGGMENPIEALDPVTPE
ncbi:MAG: hypothetical protein K6G53_00320 [Bacteroidales bacterium]|nr:hypothetical protein [Bacteroidales bacterium]